MAGCEDGSIRNYALPFDGKPESFLNLHCESIADLTQSPCGQYVITAGEDGIVFVSQISGRKSTIEKNPSMTVVEDSLAELMLFEKSHI